MQFHHAILVIDRHSRESVLVQEVLQDQFIRDFFTVSTWIRVDASLVRDMYVAQLLSDGLTLSAPTLPLTWLALNRSFSQLLHLIKSRTHVHEAYSDQARLDWRLIANVTWWWASRLH